MTNLKTDTEGNVIVPKEDAFRPWENTAPRQPKPRPKKSTPVDLDWVPKRQPNRRSEPGITGIPGIRQVINLFDPANHARLMSVAEGNPGARERWDVRPAWDSLVSGNGKPGSGKESVVSDEAQFAWALVYKDDGTLAAPPKASRYASRPVKPAEQTKRQRRTTVSLKQQVAELKARGLVPIAIADVLNLSDRRTRELLKQAV